MSKRRFEMFQFRQVLARMRQSDSDRDIARDGLMGRKKCARVRAVAVQHGWLDSATPLPDDGVLAQVFGQTPRAVSSVSSLESLRENVIDWFRAGLQGTTIHAALQRKHGFTGSYSAVHRLLQSLAPEIAPDATSRLDFRRSDLRGVLGGDRWRHQIRAGHASGRFIRGAQGSTLVRFPGRAELCDPG